MKVVTMYEAQDGKHFRSESDCIKHESECENLAAANEMLANGATLMASLSRFHQSNPIWDARLTAEDKVRLMHITKNTGFVVSHWQCRYEAGYKPCDIDLAGKVYLWGNAGSWSGSYGGWCTLEDVLRYAKDTEQRK